MKREPLLRRKSIATIAFGMVAGVVLAITAWLHSINEEPQIAFPPVAKRPSPNGFDWYVQSAQAVVHFKPPVDELFDEKLANYPKVRAQRYSLARCEVWMKANTRALTLFQKAQTYPCMSPDTRPVSHPVVYTALMGLGRAKAIEIRTRKRRGDWPGAAKAGLDAIQMGIDVPRAGGYAAKQLGMWITALEVQRMDGIAPHLTAAQAMQATARLETLLARRVPGARAMGEEKWVQITNLLDWMHQKNWRGERSFPQSWFLLGISSRRMVSKRALAAGLSDGIDRAIADMQQPYSVRLPSRPQSRVLEEFLNVGWSHPDILRFEDAREVTGLNILLLQLALRGYQAEHGSLPQSLEELSPRYLKAIPSDPFADGAPLHYRRDGRMYRLWSVGPDGKDDGGQPIPIEHSSDPLAFIRLDSKGDWIAGLNH